MASMTKVRLTDIAIQKMPPPAQGRQEIADAVIQRLVLRITPRGHKSWSFGYHYNGKLRRLTIGPFPAFNVTAARDAAMDAMRLISKGEDPAYLKKQKIEVQRIYTFGAVLDLYIERYAKQNRTWRQKKRIIDLYAIPRWRDKPIDSIQKKDVIKLIDDVMDQGVPYSANNLFSALRKLFNWAAERDLIAFSPCLHVKLPKQPEKRERVLTDAELRAIWPVCTAIAMLMLGLRCFLDFAVARDAVSEASAEEWWSEAKAHVQKLADNINEQLRVEDPVINFFEMLRVALAGGTAHVASTSHGAPSIGWESAGWKFVGGQEGQYVPNGKCIGWVEGNNFYLWLKGAELTAKQQAGWTNNTIHVSKEKLVRMMAAKDMILSHEPGRNQIRLFLQNSRPWVVHLSLKQTLGFEMQEERV